MKVQVIGHFVAGSSWEEFDESDSLLVSPLVRSILALITFVDWPLTLSYNDLLAARILRDDFQKLSCASFLTAKLDKIAKGVSSIQVTKNMQQTSATEGGVNT